jgi:hypothetical protein
MFLRRYAGKEMLKKKGQIRSSEQNSIQIGYGLYYKRDVLQVTEIYKLVDIDSTV